jgi:hypothetical protein
MRRACLLLRGDLGGCNLLLRDVTAQAQECVRTIVAWKPLPVKPRLVRLPGKGR